MSLPHPRIITLALLTVAALALGAAGCGDDHHASSDSTDTAFVADMVPHHESAIEMAQIARRRATHPEVKTLAANIIRDQKSEIGLMNSMAKAMGTAGHDSMGDGGHGGMGMSMKEMGMDMEPADLESAKPFDLAFLTMMIPHHQGAIRMARAQLADGQDTELRDLAERIIAAQTKEIAQMREWKTMWYGSREPHMNGM